MGRRRNTKKSNYQVTWAQAVRDIFIASMNRGQLPIVGLIFVVIFILWRMPAEDVSKLAFTLLSLLEAGEMWAYIALMIVLIGWYTHARIMRKTFSTESNRIGKEKSKMQSKAANTNFKSSE